MITITASVLRKIAPKLLISRADIMAHAIDDALREFRIESLTDVEMFLAQAAHETGGFIYLREIWGPTKAQEGYERRVDLGNAFAGDGKKFLGRGFFQVTGRGNYRRASIALYKNTETLLDAPELLEHPIPAARSAAWFWDYAQIMDLIPKGIEAVTKRINGGLNGLDSRREYLARVRTAFV